MNYFIYFVGGDVARQYLGGTNHVGVWADTQTQANDTVKKYFAVGTQIMPATKKQVQGQIGCLY